HTRFARDWSSDVCSSDLSSSRPGTLYSYGPRYTTGIVSKLPCGGGEAATHSSVFAFHGLRSAVRPRSILLTKLKRNTSWNDSIKIVRAACKEKEEDTLGD